MPKIVSSPNLIQELKRLNKRILEIALCDFSSLTLEQLHWKPTENQWSILECLAHLNHVNNRYLPMLQTALAKAKQQNPSPQQTFTTGWLGNYMIHKIQLNANSVPPKNIETPSRYLPALSKHLALNKQKVFDTFTAHQKLFMLLLQEAQNINLEKTKVGITAFNLISLRFGDLLKLLSYHNERHLVQAQRVLYHDYFLGNVPINILLSAQNQSSPTNVAM